MNTELIKANKSYSKAQGRMNLLPNYYKWIYDLFSQYIRGKTMEIGAGAGHFISQYINQVQCVYALDYNKSLIESIKKKFSPDKVTTVFFDLNSSLENLNLTGLDTIIALDVLEHMEYDAALILQLKNLLKSNGCMLIKVPAQSKLFGDIDKSSGHYRRYDPKSIRQIMNQAEMEEKLLQYINRLGALIYKSRRNRNTNFSRTFNPDMLRLINLAIPLIGLVDGILPGKGLSLIGVYKKKSSVVCR